MEYESEHINWSHIAFIDNQDVLDLLCMKKVNLLALVDEESKFPQVSEKKKDINMTKNVVGGMWNLYLSLHVAIPSKWLQVQCCVHM